MRRVWLILILILLDEQTAAAKAEDAKLQGNLPKMVNAL